MAHANHLASPKLNGRAAYTADERAAAAYLEEKLRRFGVSPIAAMGADARTGQTTYQLPFSVSASKASANVVGVVTGHDADQLGEYVVVGAHYDHLGRRNGQLYAGAEDNASGTAVVLEIARALVANQQRLGRSVMVVFFGAEEVGMVGSRQFVQHPPIAVSAMHSMVNIDMIGRPLADQAALAWPKRMMGIDARRSVGVLGTKNRPVFRAIVDKACHDAGISAVAPEDLPAGLQRQVEKQAQGRGDSFSFEDVKVPALFFSSGESDDYHEPSDTVDRLDPAVLELRAKAIFDVVVALTHAPRIDAASAKPAASGAP